MIQRTGVYALNGLLVAIVCLGQPRQTHLGSRLATFFSLQNASPVVNQISYNNRIHSDSKKRRSSFLVALLFAASDAGRSAKYYEMVE